jgi:DNA-binding transcriptional MerR regulator
MGDVQDGFLIGQVARLTGVDKRTLDYWDLSGFLTPSLARPTGKGTQRRWSFEDLVALRVAGQLRQAGISLQALRRVVAHLRGRGVERPLSSTYLVSDGWDVFEVTGDAAVSTLRQPGQAGFMWLVDLGSVVDELRAAIAA